MAELQAADHLGASGTAEARGARGPNLRVWALSGVVATVALFLVFRDGLVYMVRGWNAEEYSHAWLIPLIAAFLIWRRRDDLAAVGVLPGTGATPVAGRWAGLAVVLGGVALGVLGELSTLYIVIQYAFLVALSGVALALVGWRGLALIWVPLAYLVFMVPLPDFLYVKLSGELQLISSKLGVAVIRLFGIPVFLEGNVIDLGIYKLQVVEACSGLRYLFPLMSFGFLCAYLYKGPFWQRAVLFLSTVPITILMNSFRIGVVGVAVDRWGIEQAEGAMHFFEGWVIFMSCVVILFLEMWLFVSLRRGGRRSLTSAFRLDIPPLRGGTGAFTRSPPSRAWLGVVFALVVGAGASLAVTQRVDTIPPRQPFVAFPAQVADWQGQRNALDPRIVRRLKLTDYLYADYFRPADGAPVNLYVAYYGSQRKGEAVHSPRSCIPGGGWEIEQLSVRTVEGAVARDGVPFRVNRAIIAKDGMRQLVYYWFDQRGRDLTNEYQVKWYLFWDGMTRNRTDGALIRLVTPITAGDRGGLADRRLADFLRQIYPLMDRHIPT